MTSDSLHHFDTVVIGGGQAGLVMGYYLTQQDRDFVIFDASERVGDTWRHRWESLRLFTQAQYSSLPGMSFPASDSYYPTKDEMADYLEAYAERFDLPVYLDTRVDTLTHDGDRYALDAGAERFAADHVVVATGPFRRPNIPAFADELDPSITHLHSSDYRTPDQIPDGDVLVVGAGNSGAEIVTELAATDRHIWLSGRSTGHVPISIFNSRTFWWLFGTILTVDTLIGRALNGRFQGQGDPVIRLTSRDIRRVGVKRVPRTAGVRDGIPYLDDGQTLDVAAVLWATGFRPDYSWIEVPGMTLDEDGYPVHDRGVVDGVPGLDFLGLPFQSTLVSPTIGGVGTDARYLAEQMQTETDSSDSAFQSQVQDSSGRIVK